MKKNWVLRLGLLAMVLTLVTMPMVSSTYAKYVTTATGTDTATVAKWGLVLNADATNLFGDDYEPTTTEATGDTSPSSVTATVQGAASADVVAPGTKGSFDFTITGKPEVSVALTFATTINRTGWSLETALGTQDYDPIKWSIKNNAENYWNGSAFASPLVSFNSANFVSEMTKINASTAMKYSPNYNFTANTESYTISWEWPFEGTTIWKTFADIDTLLYTKPDTTYNPVADAAAFDSTKTYYTRSGADGSYVYTVVPAVFFTGEGAITYDYLDTFIGDVGTATLAPTFTITATQIN